MNPPPVTSLSESSQTQARLLEFTKALEDVLQQLPDKITGQVLNAMDMQNRTRVENLLRYPEDTAGGLRALKIDPAIAGSVVLTTITDVVGFMSFLGLATLFYA